VAHLFINNDLSGRRSFMRVWQIPQFGLGNLKMVEVTRSEPGPKEILIRVHAVSLNYRDLMVARGEYNPRMQLPRIPCSDGAGVIEAIGPEVTRVEVGDRVCGIFMQRWLEGPANAESSKAALGGDIDGMLAEYVVLSEEGVVRVPSHLSLEEAATLPCAALTAWNALHHAGDPVSPAREGETVLILGTGGVSVFALQFARLMGLRVIGTSSSDEKLERMRQLGLDSGCNYRERPEWEKWAVEMTGGRGVDRVIEVGGAETFGKSLRAARVGGLIAQIGVLSGGSADATPLVPILHKQLRVQGIYVGSRAMFEEMNGVIDASKFRPVIDRVFSMEEAPDAFRHMESGSHLGKVVIRATS
jgi:NADPH:quinone reductase-like Zn-dependent oxidoreductase